MFKILLLSIGLMLVFEGLIYFLFARNMKNYLDQLKKIIVPPITCASCLWIFFLLSGLSTIETIDEILFLEKNKKILRMTKIEQISIGRISWP